MEDNIKLLTLLATQYNDYKELYIKEDNIESKKILEDLMEETRESIFNLISWK